MLSQGGFNGKGLGKGDVSQEHKRVAPSATKYIGYWMMTGKKDEAGKIVHFDGDIDKTIEQVLDGFVELIRVFRLSETPFYAVPDTGNAPRFNDYELVSRLKEWAALDGDESGEGI